MILILEAIRIPDSVKYVGENALTCPYLDEISLPRTLKDVKVKSIGEGKVPEIIIRGQDVAIDTNKKSTSDGIIIERE